MLLCDMSRRFDRSTKTFGNTKQHLIERHMRTDPFRRAKPVLNGQHQRIFPRHICDGAGGGGNTEALVAMMKGQHDVPQQYRSKP